MSSRRALLAVVAGVLLATGTRPPGAWAASPAERALTLDDALRIAIAGNPSLAGRVVDVSVATARIEQARGLDDFVVGTNASWSSYRGPTTAAQSTPLTPYDALDVNASLTRPLSTGGSVGLKVDSPWARVGGAAGPSPTSDAYEPSVQLVATQSLLRGRGYDVARAPIRQAFAQKDVAGWALESAADALARDVTLAYWELAFASGSLALQRASLEAARGQLRATRAQIDVGKQPASASAEVEVSIAQREDDAVASEAAEVDRQAELVRLLGVDRAAALRATDRPPLAPAPDGDVLARALARNADVHTLALQATAARIDVDVAQNGMLPQLDVTASGGPMGNATDVAHALRTLGRFGGYTVQAGLVFQEPVERRAQRGARDAAEGLVTRAQTSERDARTRVASAVASAIASLEATRRRIDLLDHATSVASLDLEGEEARFQAGRSTNFDVLRRQQALTDVRVRLLRAQIDNAEASAALDALTDDILERHALAVRTETP